MPRQAPAPVRCWAVVWDGWSESVRSPFLASALSSRLVPSWQRWRESVLAGAVGGLTGALIGMGIPEYEAKRYEGRVKDGGILLSVHSDTSEEIKRGEGNT